METRVTGQLLLLLSNLCLGFGLGLVYDLFRILRRHSGPLLCILWDGAYCVLAAVAVFSLAMGPGGGELRFSAPVLAAAGAGAYLALLSPLLLPCMVFAADIPIKWGKLLINQVKKLLKFLKTSFQERKKGLQ